SEEDLVGAGIKFSPLYLPDPHWLNLSPLVLGHGRVTDGSFWSRALPDSAYRLDQFRGPWCFELRSGALRDLFDSLLALPPVRDARVVTSDSVSLTLRRVVRGHPQQYQCTLASRSAERAVDPFKAATPPSPSHHP